MLLRSAGIEPRTVAPEVDETAVADAAAAAAGVQLAPHEVVQLLAQAKAEAVVEMLTGGAGSAGGAAQGAVGSTAGDSVPAQSLVLGGDSVFVLDGVIYGKPHTPEKAAERWRLQRGRTGALYSGHWLIDLVDGVVVRACGEVAVAEVTFAADITDTELDAYIATGEPLYVAGAFTIDSLGAPFISGIVGDPSTVVGLSLPTLRRLVRQLGHEWPSLWNRSA
jgi:septum formation protein